MLQKELR